MKDKAERDQMKLDKNLKKMMASKKLSLKNLSGNVGVPSSTIHGWLNGAAPKLLVDLKKIADFFKVLINELCFGIPENSVLLYFD